jgi:hypothetical protein
MIKRATRRDYPIHSLEALRGAAENIAQQPFHVIPGYGACFQFASHGQSKAAMREIVGPGVDKEALGPHAGFRAEYRSILFAVSEPLRPAKSVSQDSRPPPW